MLTGSDGLVSRTIPVITQELSDHAAVVLMRNAPYLKTPKKKAPMGPFGKSDCTINRRCPGAHRGLRIDASRVELAPEGGVARSFSGVQGIGAVCIS